MKSDKRKWILAADQARTFKEDTEQKRRNHWWERFAVLVSALALVVSGISTGIAAYQTSLIKDQLTATDRNRATEALYDAVVQTCDVVLKAMPYGSKGGPFKRLSGPTDGSAPSLTTISRSNLERMSNGDRAAVLDRMNEARSAVSHAHAHLQLWIPAERQDSLDRLMGGINLQISPITLKWDKDPDQFYIWLLQSRWYCTAIPESVSQWALGEEPYLNAKNTIMFDDDPRLIAK